MYEMPTIHSIDDQDNNKTKTSQLQLNETTGNENFFLVDFWSKAHPPLALLNQRGLKNSSSTHDTNDDNNNISELKKLIFSVIVSLSEPKTTEECSK